MWRQLFCSYVLFAVCTASGRGLGYERVACVMRIHTLDQMLRTLTPRRGSRRRRGVKAGRERMKDWSLRRSPKKK